MTALVKSFPFALKFLYDLDILDEESIMNWARGSLRGEYAFADLDTGVLKELRTASKPFITWLEQAEEEAGEESSEDESESEGEAGAEGEDFDVDDI